MGVVSADAESVVSLAFCICSGVPRLTHQPIFDSGEVLWIPPRSYTP